VNEAPRSAILLAAGCSRRLGELTSERPKCLLEVGGRSLIQHQIAALRDCGIDDIVIVTGYLADTVEAACGAAARYVLNPVYDTTNSLYSLHLALRDTQLASAPSGFVLTNADVLFHPQLLRRLVESNAPDALLYEHNPRLGDEEMKVRVEDGLVRRFGKDLAAGSYHGENLGVLKFSARGAARLAVEAERRVAAGDVNSWAPRAFDAMCEEIPIRAIPTGSLPWIEIDFPADLERARAQVWPLIAGAPPRPDTLLRSAAD
jgi:L-glutamine-phosphate cytidylyltransferase